MAPLGMQSLGLAVFSSLMTGQITRNHFNALNSLLSIYQDLEKQITFLQAVKAQVETPSSVRQILIWIYKDILAFHVKAMEFFNKSS